MPTPCRRLAKATAALLVLLAAAAEAAGLELSDQGASSAAAATAPALPEPTAPPPSHHQAYASLLYGDDFLTGLRVLGQSLRETNTNRDLVALATRDVSDASVQKLTGDGWRVKRVELVSNPGTWTQTATQRFPARFYGVYTKLLLWNLTEYERVVYLDADTIVARNADDLFLCDGLCGVLRHSERINTGVMVLTPSAPLYEAMMASIASTPSYTGGDQGFINSFFADFPEAPLFYPRRGRLLSETSSWRTATGAAQGLPLGRLPTVYNADLGLFVFNSNRWTLPPREIRVLHFTLATFKPWDWWSGWVIGSTSVQWQALRSRLPPSADGIHGGRTSEQQTAAIALLLLPLLTIVLLVHRYLWREGLGPFLRCLSSRVWQAVMCPVTLGSRHALLPASRENSPQQSCTKAELQQLLDLAAAGGAHMTVPAWLTAAAAAAGVFSVLASLGAVVVLIPHQIVPAIGWVLAYELCSLSIMLFYSLFLQSCYRGGWASSSGRGASAAAAGPLPPSPEMAAPPLGGGLARPWGPSLALFAAILGSLGLIPWWTGLLGIQSFVAKVLLTITLGVVTIVFCTQCFISLAARWWSCGAAEAAAVRCASSKLAA